MFFLKQNATVSLTNAQAKKLYDAVRRKLLLCKFNFPFSEWTIEYYFLNSGTLTRREAIPDGNVVLHGFVVETNDDGRSFQCVLSLQVKNDKMSPGNWVPVEAHNLSMVCQDIVVDFSSVFKEPKKVTKSPAMKQPKSKGTT